MNIFFSLFLILNKYSFNGLPLTEFNLVSTGNLITIILAFLFFIALYLLWRTSGIHIGHLRTISALSIFAVLPLVLIFILNSINFRFEETYLLGYPLRKIIPAIFYVTSFCSYLLIIVILFYLIRGYKLFSYVYASGTLIVLVLIMLFIPFTWSLLNQHHDDNNSKADLGVVLGAAVYRNNKPSPIFLARIEKGAKLLRQGRVKKLYLTGGNAPGEISESKSAMNYLISNYNIQNSDLIIEEITSTTNEQIRYFKKLFSNSKSKPKILFISDEFHLNRIEEMIKFYNFDAKVIPSEYNLNYKKSLYYRFRDSISLLLFWLFGI